MDSNRGSEGAAFGVLIRQRRQLKSLSQESLAATAFGNADRKSFISALENNRLTKVTSATAQRLCAALDIAREEIPEPLRWPVDEGGAAIARRIKALEDGVAVVPDRQAIVAFVNVQLARAVGLSLTERYLAQLKSGLAGLGRWTGRPFSLQSLFVSYAIGLLYVVIAALLTYSSGDVVVGSVSLFYAADWVESAWAAFVPIISLILVVGASLACWSVLFPFGRRTLSSGQKALRLGLAALLSGVSSGIVAYLGANSLVVAVLFAVPCFAAVSTLKPRAAMIAGAAGGVVAGLAAPVSAVFQPIGDADLAAALIEGFLIGSVIGLIAGVASSKTRLRIPHLGGGQLAGSGAGIACGSVLCLATIMAGDALGAADTATLGVFAVIWLALPMANALLDYLSLGVSHAIASLIVHRKLGGGIIALLAILDLGTALLLMVLTVTMIGLTLAALSSALGIETLSLTFLEASVSDPWGQGFWLTIMVLTTCVWTWLHFAGVVAPLAAGLLARLAERAATKRLAIAKKEGTPAISAGLLVGLRYPIFYVSWAALAVLPVIYFLNSPAILNGLLQIGLQHAKVLLAG